MKKLLPLLLCVSVLAAHAQTIRIPGPGGKGPTGSITVQLAQSCVANGGTGSATATLGSNPSNTNLVVAFVESGDDGGAATSVSMSDGFGGGTGSWTAMTTNPIGSGTKIWGFYKALTGSPSGATVTADPNGSQTTTLHVCVFSATGGTPTWSVDGAQSSGTGTGTSLAITTPASTITTTSSSGVLLGFLWGDGCNSTAGSGFTIGSSSSNWATTDTEYRILTSAGSYAVNGASNGCGSENWMTLGIAFKAN